MKFVEIYRTTADGQVLMGRVELVNNRIQFSGLSDKFVKILHEGIIAPPIKKERLYPKDGLLFLEGLQYEFTGSYARASKVNERR